MSDSPEDPGRPGDRPLAVAVMGASFATGNRGVAALMASLVRIFLLLRPDARLSLFIGARTSAPQECTVGGRRIRIDVVNFRLAPWSRPRENMLWIFLLACAARLLPPLRAKIVRVNAWLRALDRADLVADIRGGDSFTDMYGMDKFLLGSLPRLAAVCIGKPLYLLPQTYGPYRRRFTRRIAAYILGRASTVMSRDHAGADVVRELFGSSRHAPPVVFCPDVAFMLEPVAPERFAVEPPLTDAGAACMLGFNPNGLLYNGGYTRSNMFDLKFDYRAFVHDLVARILAETEAHIMLVPHTYGAPGTINSDPDACQAILADTPAGVRGRLHLVTGEYNQSEIKHVISRCDCFIGSRMHACIAALSQGLPTLAIAYSRKFKGVFDAVGLEGSVLDARNVDRSEALDATLSFVKQCVPRTRRDEETVRVIQEKILKSFADHIPACRACAGPHGA